MFDIEEFPPIYIGPTWRRGEDGKFILPEKTLGWEIAGWCSKYLRDPNGEGSFKFTFEQLRFILWWYAVDETGRFVYRRGLLQRLKGWGKDPLAAVVSWIEAAGPSRFSHWDREGNPVGKPHPAPWVEIYAVSREQTINTTLMLPVLMTPHFKAEYSVSDGKEVTYIGKTRGTIRVRSAGHRSTEGGRPSFMVLGEVQHWVPSNGGVALYQTVSFNASKGGNRYLAITNAYLPGEGSVGEDIRHGYEQVAMGKAVDTGWLYDSIEAHPQTPLTVDALRQVLPLLRGDSVWLPIEDVILEALDPTIPPARSRRMWLNQIVADEDALIGPEDMQLRETRLASGEEIVLGFDGAYVNDATALIAVRVSDGHAFPLLIEERPLHVQDWEIDRDKVDFAVYQAFERYKVLAMFCDVRLWESYISKWVDEFGHRVKVSASERSKFSWDMRGQTRRTVQANELTIRMIRDGQITFSNPDSELEARFRNHILNARRRENRDGISFGKETRDSPKKVDGYAALVLAVAALDKLRQKGHKKGGSRGWFI